MTATSKNAGQTVTVEGALEGLTITVTENWQRLFIVQGGSAIVVDQSAYPALVAAIQHFVAIPKEATLNQSGDLIGSPLEQRLRAQFRRIAKHHGLPNDGVVEADLVRAFLSETQEN